MQGRERLIALAIVFTASACERTTMPTAPAEDARALFSVGAASVTSFPIPTPNSGPRQITLAADGNMWFTESNANQIARLNADGTITEFVVPSAFASPEHIAAASNAAADEDGEGDASGKGALWFTEPSGFPDGIGRATTKGKFKEFGLCDPPPRGCSSIVPQGIAVAPDGNVWFTEQVRSAIVKLTPQGKFTFYPTPTLGANPNGITVGPDGALWFAEFNANQIGRIDPFDPLGRITEFGSLSDGPMRITTGPDGNLWFTEPFGNRIGRLTPSGVVSEFALLTANAHPRDIVAGPDGNLWFTEYLANQLARITSEGVITEVQPLSGPWGIGRGANNDLWITHIDANLITRFTLSP